MSGKIQGIDIAVSFTVGSGGSASVGGNLVHKTTETSASTYKYCFGNNHSYDWDNLGGASDSLASAFRTNW